MKYLFFIINTFLSIALFAQDLPKEVDVSSDGRQILSGKKSATGGFYDSATIRKIDIVFPESNWRNILTANYASKTNHEAIVTIDGVAYPKSGVRYKGNTSYRSVPGDKKSFNISLDYKNQDQEVDDYSTLNLNNAFQDNSMMKEVFYLHQIRNHIPAAKANFSLLTVNNENFGLYSNVQQINKTLVKEWFKNNNGALWRADPLVTTTMGGGGFGTGQRGLNFLGKDTAIYQRNYELKYSEVQDPWTKLVTVTEKLSTTTNTETSKQEIQKYLDVDKVLWHLACETALGDDDSYVFKGGQDYYVCYDEATSTFIPIEYDGNSVMGNTATNWTPFQNGTNVNFPLMNKLYAIPEYRQRYLAHYRTVLNELVEPSKSYPVLDNLLKQIKQHVYNDPKKLVTNQNFDLALPIIKTWLQNRYNSHINNSEIREESPIISEVTTKNNNGLWKAPFDDQEQLVTARVSHFQGVSPLLYYKVGLYSSFVKSEMRDDGKIDDGVANNGIFGAKIPPQNSDAIVSFYVEAVANNTAKTVSYSPVGAEHDVYFYHVGSKTQINKTIVINEFMASNTKTIKDEAGEFEDWIEIYNPTNQAINVGGYYLSDNPLNLNKWRFKANTIIPANGYFVIWADEDSAQDSITHCNFKLAKEGEQIFLLDNALKILDSITYQGQTSDLSSARIPNGTGPFKGVAATFKRANDGTSITKEETTDSWSLFPNPTLERLIIQSDLTLFSKSFKIYDILGKQVMTGRLNQEQNIDVSMLNKGYYFIAIDNVSNTFVKVE